MDTGKQRVAGEPTVNILASNTILSNRRQQTHLTNGYKTTFDDNLDGEKVQQVVSLLDIIYLHCV